MKWMAIGLCLTTLTSMAYRAAAQSTLPLTGKIASPRQAIAQAPTTPERSQLPTSSQVRFALERVEVLGNTVLQQEIANLVEQYEERTVTFEDLIELRSKITQLYVDRGYVTSGAFLPNNQNLSSGVVKIQVVEGELERIELSGLTRLQAEYVRSRLKLATSTPINQQRIEEALQLLQLDPTLEQVNAELMVGTSPGRNILAIALKEASPFHFSVALNNHRSPSIGSLQGSAVATYDNLFGFGDRFQAEYGLTEGLDIYDFNYKVPFNARDGTLSLRLGNSDSRIVEADFRDLNFKSETQTYSLSFRQPITRKLNRELALSLALDLRRSQIFLDDAPFSFRGLEDGESKVTVLRFTQDWVDRGTQRVLAASSQFSFGIDAFDATDNNTETDGQFFSWLGQFQWVQQLSTRTLLISSLAAQLTPDSLLPLERIGIGGSNTVRGYRQNQLVSDNGIFGTIEGRIPLTSDIDVLQLSPFFDFGVAWNNFSPNPDPRKLASFGLGLQWSIRSDLFMRVDYGVPLIEVEERGDSLQDNGFYFSIQYQPF